MAKVMHPGQPALAQGDAVFPLLQGAALRRSQAQATLNE